MDHLPAKPCRSVETGGRTLRVLHVGKFYPPFKGGMEVFLRDLARTLVRKGLHVAVLVHEDAFRLGITKERDPCGVTVFRVPAWGRLAYAPIAPVFPATLSKLVRCFEPDLVHFHLPNTSAFAALLLPTVRSLPWIVHWHADVVPSLLDLRLRLLYGLYRPWERVMLRRSRLVVATSLPYLKASKPLRPYMGKCRVVPLGLDEDRLPEPDEEALNGALEVWGKTSFRILSVGRLTYYKGHEVLLRAMVGLDGAKAIIVGSGEKGWNLARLIRRLGLRSKVFLAGPLPDKELHALMVTSSVLCLPSVERTEAFGLVILEAMRYAKPVVVSDVPGSGMGWVVRHGETGLLVPPSDPVALRAALAALRDDPEVAEAMGRKGRDRFQSTFRMENIAREILELYQR